jgi:hypothetical protein
VPADVNLMAEELKWRSWRELVAFPNTYAGDYSSPRTKVGIKHDGERMRMHSICWGRCEEEDVQNSVYARQTQICLSELQHTVGLSLSVWRRPSPTQGTTGRGPSPENDKTTPLIHADHHVSVSNSPYYH